LKSLHNSQSLRTFANVFWTSAFNAVPASMTMIAFRASFLYIEIANFKTEGRKLRFAFPVCERKLTALRCIARAYTA